VILATAQPYFAPFPGFFFKAAMADVLVILDTVQFPRGFTWLTRNRFKNDQGTLWMSVPVWRKGRGLQRIDEVKICREGRWARKHLAGIKTAYANAPFLSDHIDFLEGIFDLRHDRLVDLNMAIISHLMAGLGIGTKLVRLSEMRIEAKGSDLLVGICRELRADCFLAQRPARKFIEAADFGVAGIDLRYIDPPAPVYPQLWGDFVSNLSALDLLLCCGPKSKAILLGPKGRRHHVRPLSI
jgi:WbqC-like protein family